MSLSGSTSECESSLWSPVHQAHLPRQPTPRPMTDSCDTTISKDPTRHQRTPEAQVDASARPAVADFPLQVFPDSAGPAAPTGSVPGSGAPDHHGDVRGVFGNPMMFQHVFHDLSGAFSTAIHAIEDEAGSGLGSVAKALIKKLEDMRGEIDDLRAGKSLPEAEGGEKNEQVERAQGDGGGLYKE
ncbi:hypothetical protein P7C73_g2875, partial [Tremellales sp. Uapishka_1]